MLEASDDPVEQAYAEAYRAGCFVVEVYVEEGLEFTGVGELAAVTQAEQTFDAIVDISQFGIQECMDLGAHPGKGMTREDRIYDGAQQSSGSTSKPV